MNDGVPFLPCRILMWDQSRLYIVMVWCGEEYTWCYVMMMWSWSRVCGDVPNVIQCITHLLRTDYTSRKPVVQYFGSTQNRIHPSLGPGRGAAALHATATATAAAATAAAGLKTVARLITAEAHGPSAQFPVELSVLLPLRRRRRRRNGFVTIGTNFLEE